MGAQCSGRTEFKPWGWALGVGTQSSGKCHLKPGQVRTAVSPAQRYGPSGPVTPVPGLGHSRRHLALPRLSRPGPLRARKGGAPRVSQPP